MILHSIKSLEETYMKGSGSLPPIRGCGLLPRVLPPYNFASSSYHFTDSDSASVSFQWSGTAIWLYGNFSSGSGAYGAMVDDSATNFTSRDLFARETPMLLYSATNLSQTSSHTMRLFNLANANTLKFTHLVFETEITSDGDSADVERSYNGSSSFSYLPNQQGSAAPSDFTDSPGSEDIPTLCFNFTGLAIALYGIPSVYPSSFAIVLDDTATQRFTSNSLISTLDVDNTSDIPVQQTDARDQVSSNNSSQLIYFASNLSEGPHQLLIFDYGNGTNTNASASGLSSIRIDHAEVYSALNSTSGAQSADGQPSKSSRSRAMLVAPPVSVGLILLFLIICLWRVRARGRRTHGLRARPFTLQSPLQLSSNRVDVHRGLEHDRGENSDTPSSRHSPDLMTTQKHFQEISGGRSGAVMRVPSSENISNHPSRHDGSSDADPLPEYFPSPTHATASSPTRTMFYTHTLDQPHPLPFPPVHAVLPSIPEGAHLEQESPQHIVPVQAAPRSLWDAVPPPYQARMVFLSL